MGGLVPFDPERVLSRLQLKLQTPTPPASETAIAARQTPKTPYTVAQLAQEYTTIKGLLKRRLKSPPSPTERALKRVVKGCQIAIHNCRNVEDGDDDKTLHCLSLGSI